MAHGQPESRIEDGRRDRGPLETTLRVSMRVQEETWPAHPMPRLRALGWPRMCPGAMLESTDGRMPLVRGGQPAGEIQQHVTY